MITDTYLLASHDDGEEFVVQYTPAEMDELFTQADRLDLDACKAVVKPARCSLIRYVSMIAAAREVA